LFIGWVLIVFFTFPSWITVLVQNFGTAGAISGGAFWLGHGVVMMYFFRCSECGLSPFLSNKGFITWSAPWPRKTCGYCGRDHTRQT